MISAALPIRYTYFSSLYDNIAKSTSTTWRSFTEMVTHGHPVTTEPKDHLPAFNAWQYKGLDDPTLAHGQNATGKKSLKCFRDKDGKAQVRRLSANLVAMSMLVIDFDGGLPLEAVRDRFGGYEFICYTSISHRTEGKDKFRLILPFTHPMPVSEFKRRVQAIKRWIDLDGENVADDVSYSLGQLFLLPAVRPEGVAQAKNMHNMGDLLDWQIFAATAETSQATTHKNGTSAHGSKDLLVLKPYDVLETSAGQIRVKDIDQKISNVLCPFHGDSKPSEFVAVTGKGLPFLHCKRCGTIYMDRPKDDPLIEGLKRNAEKRTQRQQESK